MINMDPGNGGGKNIPSLSQQLGSALDRQENNPVNNFIDKLVFGHTNPGMAEKLLTVLSMVPMGEGLPHINQFAEPGFTPSLLKTDPANYTDWLGRIRKVLSNKPPLEVPPAIADHITNFEQAKSSGATVPELQKAALPIRQHFANEMDLAAKAKDFDKVTQLQATYGPWADKSNPAWTKETLTQYPDIQSSIKTDPATRDLINKFKTRQIKTKDVGGAKEIDE